MDNLEIDDEQIDDEQIDDEQIEEEENEYKKIKLVHDNHEKFPHNCQAGILNGENGTDCNGPILGHKFVCRYRPNIRDSCDHYQNINFCVHHYNLILGLPSNKGVKPEPYYEWRVSEAIYELIKDICLEYK